MGAWLSTQIARANIFQPHDVHNVKDGGNHRVGPRELDIMSGIRQKLAKSPQCQGCKTPDAKASQGSRPFATCDDHRQAPILWRRKTRYHARRRASLAQGLEQSSREFPSADPKTGEDHKAVQVGTTSSALRFHPRPIANLVHIPRHDIPSAHHRELRATAIQIWSDIARLHAN